MKIGILTYHRAHNYGALLQAYALKTWLEMHNHKVEIIDYWPDYHSAEYQLLPRFKTRSLRGKIKTILIFILGYNKIIKRRKGYKIFIQKHLNLHFKPIYTKETELKTICYDLVIYGSDQIWRKQNFPTCKGFNEVYFGSYVNAKKISYAASMGVIEIKEHEKIELKQKLQNFDSISVREEELQHLVEEITSNKVKLVLDPVFLLEKEEWIRLTNLGTLIPKDKYILFYHLMPSREAIELTNILKTYNDCKVVEIRGRVEPLLYSKRYYQTADPLDFVSLVRHAELVVSTSFHGVAFALLFEKQFYALGMKNNSSRVQSLLNSLDIPDRLLRNINQINFEEKISYENVNKKLADLKQHSKNYLVDTMIKIISK